MNRYRVSYKRTESGSEVIGAKIVEADSINDVPEIFYLELDYTFIKHPERVKIITIKSMDEIEAFRQKIKDRIKPIKLTINDLKTMMKRKKLFRCLCSQYLPTHKIKLYPGPCSDQYLFMCRDCEQIFIVREKAVSFILKGKGINFAPEGEELILKFSTIGKSMREECS